MKYVLSSYPHERESGPGSAITHRGTRRWDSTALWLQGPRRRCLHHGEESRVAVTRVWQLSGARRSFLFKSVVQYLQIPLVKLIHSSQSHQGDRQLQRSQTRFPFFFATHWLIACRVWERNNSVRLLDVWRWFEVNVTEHPSAQCLAHVECLSACEPSTPGYYAVMCSIAIIINDLGKQLQNNWLYLMWKFML